MLAGLARGDGHPVLVMPGFGGGDSSTFSLRTNLGFWGYDVHGAGEEVNSGPTPELLAKLDGLLVDLYQGSGRRVSLVGWSIAGRCARYLTRLHPEMVRQVITMACPLQFRRGTDRGSISFIVDPIQHTFCRGLRGPGRSRRGPAAGAVELDLQPHRRCDPLAGCLDVVDERHENVEVYASHGGVAVNPSVHYVIADRLALPEDDWRPFHPPPWLRDVFPLPADWHPRTE